MNYTPAKTPTPDYLLRRKSKLYRILDAICRDLEITEAQYEAAKANYEAVSAWLSASDDPILKYLDLYAHGSTCLGTTVKPLGRDEFDVDLVCLVFGFPIHRGPAELKKIIGDRLRANARYAAMLEEKKRCWRLNYAREFHLDVSPTILNPRCDNGGELVPDKKLRDWKPTNPRGYKAIFEARAKLQPNIRFQKLAVAENRAGVEPFPAQSSTKGILRRIVQLLKRHRDIAFSDVQEDIAPISIIITTLAARSYEFCVGRFIFDTELDVLVETIRLMPLFIERPVVDGRQIYLVPNESTQGENFADRWNAEPQRPQAFYDWHQNALTNFESLAGLEGLDRITMNLEKSLGGKVVRSVMDAQTEVISKARAAKQLYVAPSVGLITSSTAKATPVPQNTFFGDNPE
jgi:hypothetical protein